MLTVDSDCCTGVKAVTVNVSGAVPGVRYNYVFDTASSEYVAFTPASGTAYFGSNGSGAINTLLGLNLVAGQEIVVGCRITHADTGVESTDFLAVKCGDVCYT